MQSMYYSSLSPMVRSMCGVSLRKEKSSDELLGRLGIVSVADLVRKGRLRWYGHGEKKDVEDWVSKTSTSSRIIFS